MNELELTSAARVPDRWTLVRDVTVLQGKLIVDGFRDLVLVPVSILAGLASLMKAGGHIGTEFYDLLRFGRRTDHWINLFGAADRIYGPRSEDDRFPVSDIDGLVSRVESFIVAEYQNGGVTKQARDRLGQALSALSAGVDKSDTS